jgi:hypothetical protein
MSDGASGSETHLPVDWTVGDLQLADVSLKAHQEGRSQANPACKATREKTITHEFIIIKYLKGSKIFTPSAVITPLDLKDCLVT